MVLAKIHADDNKCLFCFSRRAGPLNTLFPYSVVSKIFLLLLFVSDISE